MKKKLIYLMFALCAAASHAQDLVIFENGDTLTGKILTQDDEQISFESDSIGTVTLSVQDIAGIRAIAPEGIIPQVAVPKEKSSWTGQAGLAIAMREKSYSNNLGVYREEQYQTYRLYGHVNWEGVQNNLRWNWNYRYSEDETKIRDDYFNLMQRYNHTLESGYYAEAKTMYQRDYTRHIENEYLQTAEIGKKWFERPKFQFSTSIGGGYHQYERSFPGTTTSTAKPRFIFDEALQWQMLNSLTLFQKYTHLGDLEKYHFVFSSGLENKLIRNIFLRMEYRLDRDTETTYDDGGYYDRALLTSLFYEF